MFKNLKMRALITSCIAVIAIICMSFLYVVQSKDTTSVMKKIATNNMSTALDAQANMIRQYVDNSERLLKEYGSAIEIKNVLEKQNDASAQKLLRDIQKDSLLILTAGKDYIPVIGIQQYLHIHQVRRLE